MTAALANRLSRIAAVAREAGAPAAVLSSPPALRWAGLTHPLGVHLVVRGVEVMAVAELDAEVPDELRVERFDLGSERSSEDAIARVSGRLGLLPSAPMAVEAGALPTGLSAGLGRRPLIDLTPLLADARRRKDPDELDLIAEAAELASIGQGAARAAAEVGATELDIWDAARLAMRKAAGGHVHSCVDLMSGDRTQAIGLPPTPQPVLAGDAVLFDLATRRGGYWADSCSTFCPGSSPVALRRVHDTVKRALEGGLAALRPGIRAGELDAVVREILAAGGLGCPHHIGHGVGATPQEAPWIVPGDQTVIEEGMVIALEPGAYGEGIGVRLEHLALVEGSGARVLTTHSVDIA